MDSVQVTQLLNKNQAELSRQQQHDIETVYQRLKEIARTQRFKVKGTGFNTTALVNEAWLKSQDNDKTFNDRNHFFAYSAGSGGGMLIIGSAAGVVAMGMEKIDFFWYLKKISWLALIGFLAGAVVFLFMRQFV